MAGESNIVQIIQKRRRKKKKKKRTNVISILKLHNKKKQQKNIILDESKATPWMLIILIKRVKCSHSQTPKNPPSLWPRAYKHYAAQQSLTFYPTTHFTLSHYSTLFKSLDRSLHLSLSFLFFYK